ncbi:R.Pab1 family restriction endonuclease, partial [Campylobacter coli]|nr:R.Pab1 family restriction endonuclease [Campylobacter coli]
MNFKIDYELPLTSVAGKIRIKQRSTFNDYGLPVAPTKININVKHYVEWQIGYDMVAGKNDGNFIGVNGKDKKLYELSDIIFQFFKHNIILKENLFGIKNFLENNEELIEDKMKINRTNFTQKQVAGINFLESYVSYPLLVYQFNNNEFLSEIIIKEKQRAIGVQGMLYF